MIDKPVILSEGSDILSKTPVILSEAKNLSLGRRKDLRFAGKITTLGIVLRIFSRRSFRTVLNGDTRRIGRRILTKFNGKRR